MPLEKNTFWLLRPITFYSRLDAHSFSDSTFSGLG